MGGRKTKLIQAEEAPKKTSPEEDKTSEAPEKKAKKRIGPRIKKIRGKKYQAAKKKIEPRRAEPLGGARAYPVEEAVRLVKTASTAGFDASIDLHINLGLVKDKPEHQLRSFLALPHGTGKNVRVLVFAEGEAAKKAQEAGADVAGDEALIEEIAQGKLPDVDVVVATPAWMPKLARVARFLGPKGLMPSPKTGTVAENPEKAVSELKKGRVELKTEAQPIVHLSLGKVSFPEGELIANLKVVIAELNRIKPPKVSGTYIKSVILAPTMGPSVKVSLDSL